MNMTCIKNIFIVLITLFFAGCSNEAMETLQKDGELIVLTRNAPTTLYEGRNGQDGPEHALVTRFAEDHGLKVRYKIFNSVDEIIKAIQNNEGHIAAAGLTHTKRRLKKEFIFGPAYYEVQQQVVCRRNHIDLPKTPADLVGLKITIIENSSYKETLKNIRRKYPDLEWVTDDQNDTEQLLDMVWKKKIDCTLADSNIVSINRRYHPELVVAFNIGEKQAMSWLIAPKWEDLDSVLDDWFDEINEDGFLEATIERFYGHVEIFDYVDIRVFLKNIRKRLPGYIDIFKDAAKKHKISWKLLAAQAYQESHWNARAISPTGVRGIMMLTLDTAESVGVESRLDATQSIHGGAKYLRRMIDRIPDEVKDENRIWYALAAYNVGFGHLQDARELAERLGKDPNRWVEFKDVLPLLSQKEYYSTLKHGYARGTEPVRYVQRIRDYRQILDRRFK